MSLFDRDGPLLAGAVAIIGYVMFADVIRVWTSPLDTNTKLALAGVIALVLLVASAGGD